MITRTSTQLGFAAVALTAMFFSSSPAEARKHCFASASNGSSWSTSGSGSARSMSTACRRAMRRCNRKLDRAKRRHEIPRGLVTPVCRTGVAAPGH